MWKVFHEMGPLLGTAQQVGRSIVFTYADNNEQVEFLIPAWLSFEEVLQEKFGLNIRTCKGV